MKSLLILFIFFSTSVFGYENQLALKGGVGVTQNEVRGNNRSEDSFVGYGHNLNSIFLVISFLAKQKILNTRPTILPSLGVEL